MKLGIVYKDGKIVYHRSFIKVVFNPILRIFKRQIATHYDLDTQTLQGICITKGDRKRALKWHGLDNGEYDKIVRKRLIL